MFKASKEQYEKELLKQSDPYGYYIKYVEQKIKGEENAPFICIEENDEYRVYDSENYFIYESKKGTSSQLEKQKLIDEAEKLNADLIYTDSDCITGEGARFAPFFKPDWSPDYYDCFDYITEYYAIKKELNNTDIKKISRVIHIANILFHRFFDKNEDELYQSVLDRSKTPDYFSNISITDDTVSVVIPSKDNPEMLLRCIEGVIESKIKSSINIKNTVIIDNGSTEENQCIIRDFIDKNPEANINYLYEPSEFNYSNMCNTGAKECTGKYLLFLNDDIEPIDKLFISKLLHYAKLSHVGAVGAKLIYPDGESIQHIGITDLKYCGPSHKLSTFSDNKIHYYGKNKININSLAVTGACLMVSAEKYFLTGGFHGKMKVGYNDVDLCISLYEKGFFNVVVNDTVLIHHESVSRGKDISYAKLDRLNKERELLYERHPQIREYGDPFYNCNFAGDFLDYRINVIPDWENREYLSKQKPELESNARKLRDKYGDSSTRNTFCNIEGVKTERKLADADISIVISGWGLLNGMDNSLYDMYLCMYSIDLDKVLVFETARVLRKDLSEVFPDAKNSCLSGFIAKISLDELDIKEISKEQDGIELKIEKEYEYGILLKHKYFGTKHYAGFIKSDI